MANDLKILITGKLNETASLNQINRDIEKLQGSIDKIKLDFKIDDRVVNTLANFVKAMEQQKKITQDLNSVIKEQKTIIKESDGTIRESITQHLKSGEVIQKEIERINQKNKANQEEINSTRQLISEIEELGNVRKRVTNQNASGNVTGGSVTTGDKFNNTTYRYNANDEITGQRTVENVRQQEVEVEKLRQKMLELNNAGVITNSSFARMSVVLNGAETEAELNRISQALNRVQDSSRIRQQNQALEQQLQLYQRQAEIQVRALRNNPNKIISSDQQTALTNYLNNVRSLSTSNPELQQQMRQLGLDFREISSQTVTAGRNAMTFGQALQTAFEKFPIWMVASTAFFQTFNFFKDGINYVNELNKSLTEISIVTGQNQQQVAALAEQYNKLGQSMGVTTDDITKEAAELYRQGLTEDQVATRMKTITEYAKISSLDTKTASEIMTAAINSMGVSAQKAADVWSYMGDATATGKHMCPVLQ
jgi:hypothetical protein